MQISCVVVETIKEGQVGAFVEHMREMVRLTKEEGGCIAYDMYEPLEGSNEVALVEIWEGMEALEIHQETDHFKNFVPSGDVFRAKPAVVRMFRKI